VRDCSAAAIFPIVGKVKISRSQAAHDTKSGEGLKREMRESGGRELAGAGWAGYNPEVRRVSV